MINTILIATKKYQTKKMNWCDPLYMKLQLLKLNDIYKLQVAIAMYNISNKIWNIDSKTQPITSINTIHKHETRLVKKK